MSDLGFTQNSSIDQILATWTARSERELDESFEYPTLCIHCNEPVSDYDPTVVHTDEGDAHQYCDDQHDPLYHGYHPAKGTSTTPTDQKGTRA